jgi:hypothetical protein
MREGASAVGAKMRTEEGLTNPVETLDARFIRSGSFFTHRKWPKPDKIRTLPAGALSVSRGCSGQVQQIATSWWSGLRL